MYWGFNDVILFLYVQMIVCVFIVSYVYGGFVCAVTSGGGGSYVVWGGLLARQPLLYSRF